MKKIIILIAGITLVFSGINAWAGSLVVPNTFSSGKPAYAASVNNNFTAVETEVTDNAANIAANATSISQNKADISTNTANISNHTHTAGDITNGTLNTIRFSAYSDLTDEGYLNNNAGADILTRAQSDSRYSSLSHTHTGISANTFNISTNAAMITSLQNAHVGTRTGYYDVNPASCVPGMQGYTYSITAWEISNVNDISDNYSCAVHLPDGSVVKEVTVNWNDTDAVNNGEFSLMVTQQNPLSPIPMASVFSTLSAGFTVTSTTSITSPTVDLFNNSYGIIMTLHTSKTKFQRALIRYEYTLD